MELKINDQLARVYIIPGILKGSSFVQKPRRDIQNTVWISTETLSCHGNEMIPKSKLGLAPNNLLMAVPFVRP